MKNLYKEEFDAVGKSWLSDLSNYNEVPFKRRTSRVIWSLGEIYNHLGLIVNDHSTAIQNCFDSKSSGNKTWVGKVVFLKKSFKNKTLTSSSVDRFSPQSSDSIDEAKDSMYKILKSMEQLGEKVSRIQPKGKIEHPVLGWLTAEEWYLLIVMQFKYHQKNKQKIIEILVN